MRTKSVFNISDPFTFKLKLLSWCANSAVFAFFERNGFNQSINNLHLNYDVIAATGVQEILTCNAGNAFDRLRNFKNSVNDWLFGIFGYDLKNEIEKLTSKNFDGIGFCDMQFFRPELVFLLNGNMLEIQYLTSSTEIDIIAIFEEIKNINLKPLKKNQYQVNQRINYPEYLKKINALKDHIYRGDIFEVNFCLEFYIPEIKISPTEIFSYLNRNSPAPFSCLFRFHDKYLISASPERYLMKNGVKIISQPMKGTIRRDTDLKMDKNLIEKLKTDPKEISENIMIVDLVRNDLSKTALKNSVKVEELCGIYSYKTVHQMVSTICSELNPVFDEVDVIKNSFPMGSMTGAPKVSALQLIEEFEETRRGVFSGAAGFFTPSNDFDFNVVIRSILYSESNKYLSIITGSAITADSIPENEYDECLLKAMALKKVLGVTD